jgi:hypothetical protein
MTDPVASRLSSFARVAFVAVLSALVFLTTRALATDLTFAGSVQLDEFFVPTQPGGANQGTGQYGFDGLTLEASEKVAVDVTDHLSANVKVCFGCHGFELDMAYVDYRLADEVDFRAGRFSPSFGAFNLRHDVGNHKLSDKPLPYDMGRMLRLRTWNLGVLPSPFPDTGIEVGGTHWVGSHVQFDYAVYAVQGFRSTAAHPTDIDFRLSRAAPQAYYVDNDGRPTLGARLAVTAKIGPRSDITLGASGMYGTYDSAGSLTYAIWGGDISLRIAQTFVRIEYLARRTQMDVSDPSLLARTVLSPGDDHFTKHGAYVEVEQPVLRGLDAIARVDGMVRSGNFSLIPIAGTGAPTIGLARHSSVVRYTLGASVALERGLRLKMSAELWKFTDPDDDGHTQEVGLHAAMVGTF